MKKKILRWLWD